MTSPSYNSLSRRVLLTLCTAAGLSAAYGLYASIVDPLLTPAAIMRDKQGESRSTFVVTSPRENLEMADRYLAAHPWAAQARYQLRTREAFIYFDEWEPVESDEAIRFRPFAMIWRRVEVDPEQPEQIPVAIACESSYVRFANAFSVTNPQPGRVIGGSLEGSVDISGPDGLRITGRNFVFSEEALGIWSDHHVDFAYGEHRGDALGIQVELVRDLSVGSEESLAISGMRSVQLRRNVTMDLLLEQKEASEDAPPPAGVAALAAGGDGPTRVKVQSAGSFLFSSTENVATFEDNVRVARPTAPSAFDTLQCDRLTLAFVPDKSKAAAKKKDGSGSSNIVGLPQNLTFRQMHAEGKAVVLKSQENNLTARMTSLEHDAVKRRTTLKDPGAVVVQQGQSVLQCPEVLLSEGKSAGGLESISCLGEGQLQYYDPDTGSLEIAAAWKKRLRKYPAKSSSRVVNDETGQKEDVVLDLIDLEVDAILQRPQDQTALAAEFIRFWVDPRTSEGEDDDSQPENDIQLTSGTSEKAMRPSGKTPEIHRMLARDRVGMISPDMQAECERLEVWFEPGNVPKKTALSALTPRREGEAPAEPVRSPALGAGHGLLRPRSHPGQPVDMTYAFAVRQEPPPGRGLQPLCETAITFGKQIQSGAATAATHFSVLDPAFDPASQQAAPFPEPPAANPPAPAAADVAKPRQPIVVAADLIRVRVIRDDVSGESQVAEVFTEGHVRVTQFHEDQQTDPLEITGDRLQLINSSETEQLVHVFGNTAHVRDRKAHIEGREIHLDRGQNRTWVTGEGLLQLPVNQSLEGEPLATERLLDIWWKEEMTFDGQTARFFGDVRTVLDDSKLTCQDMEVKLSRRIVFGEEASAQKEDIGGGEDKIDLQSVVCKDGVQVESFEYKESRLVGVRHARFWQFTLNQKSGDTKGSGPGWITFWRRGEGKRASLTPTASVQANRALESEDVRWEYTRIDFNRGSSGNIKQRTTTFNDRVQIVYGPVAKPMEIVDPDKLPKDGGWMRCNSLQLTQHEAQEQQPAFVEMLGEGNAELEGRSFNARADTISYDESKGLYTLRSLAPRKATIWQQKKTGGEYSRAEAQRMEFIPARNQLKLDQATGLDGLQ